MHAESDLVEKARSAGAAGYLLKDASGDEVVAAVKRALDGHRVISAGLLAASNEPPEEAPSPSDQPTPQLTEREQQILQMLADGCSPADVAERLFIAPKTVRNHLTKAYDKLGASSRSQAIVTALQFGLIELPG
jgi:DNA-binding NarL/FixJ family response regulator